MSEVFEFLFGPAPEEKSSAQKPGLLRPSYVKRRLVDVSQWFPPAELWADAKAKRMTVPHGRRVEIPLVQITNTGLDEGRAAQETAYFFGKERDIVGLDASNAWDRVLKPFLDNVEEALNAQKPEGLSGRLRFDVAPDSSLMLFYVEK